MSENVERSPMRGEQVTYRTYGRIHHYGVVGVLILLCLAVAVALAYFGVQGPNLLTPAVSIWIIGLATATVALGLLYVLFTLKGALRLVRQQATEVAVVRAMSHRHEFMTPEPTPSVEYRVPPSSYERTEMQVEQERVEAENLPQSRSAEVIEGIGPTFARRLQRAGVETLRDIRACPTGDLAKIAKTNVPTAQRWKAMADLMVVPAIDPQSAEILVRSEVHSLEELADHDTDALWRRVQKVNSAGQNRIVPDDIPREAVAGWIDAAKSYDSEPSSNGANGFQPVASPRSESAA